ncbi:hypothetical protein [Pedobacter sp. Leaf176]|uniref:hypothetical protein n=1 Tax=Pedobacter sp. Leaf176 TaxID=1736286 RepID=UPI0006FD10BB|nr:hypothetical protein [Pedobacter sp. Leaf176]KQR69864.1 hypothetical protein ASF92_14280 [Pedobacter sp. Leaf176]
MKKVISILLICLTHALVFSQENDVFLKYSQGVTPLHKFFQQYADSTIIIEYANATDGKPSSYKLISRTGDFVNTFYYRPIDTAYYSSFKLKKDFNVVLWTQLMAHKIGFAKTPPDINIFFNIVAINPDTAKKIWKNISIYKPWQMVDDKVFGRGCKGIPDDLAYDGGGPQIIHFITKKEIKTLVFWYPDYYEKRCPGNKNRQSAIAISSIFYRQIPFN